MKRLIFLAPDMELAQAVVNDLHEMGVSEEMMHVVAEDHDILHKADIHEATEMETSELENDFDWGLVIGGLVGLTLGFSIYKTMLFGFEFGAGTLLVLTLVGIALGGLIGKTIGESTPSGELEKYQHAIDAGQILMMVDVPIERLPECYKMIRKHCPKALIESSHLFHDHPLAA